MIRSIVAFGLTTLATSAIAADLPVKAPAPPAPVYAWSGCYVGGNVGWARTETRFRFNGVDDGSHSSDGFAGGGQVGCDYQFSSNWVIGIQGLIDAADFGNDHVRVLFPGDTFHHDVRWFATVAGRLGFLVAPSFLIYGKGGWGWVDERFSVTNVTGALLSSRDSKNFNGPDAGVGFEWMFTPNWSLWVEWDHIFGRDRTLVFTGVGAVPVTFSERVERDFDKVLVGVNWRFGGVGSPVRAAY